VWSVSEDAWVEKGHASSDTHLQTLFVSTSFQLSWLFVSTSFQLSWDTHLQTLFVSTSFQLSFQLSWKEECDLYECLKTELTLRFNFVSTELKRRVWSWRVSEDVHLMSEDLSLRRSSRPPKTLIKRDTQKSHTKESQKRHTKESHKRPFGGLDECLKSLLFNSFEKKSVWRRVWCLSWKGSHKTLLCESHKRVTQKRHTKESHKRVTLKKTHKRRVSNPLRLSHFSFVCPFFLEPHKRVSKPKESQTKTV